MQKRNTTTLAVYAFFIRGNEILLNRRCNTGYQDGKHHVPSGHSEEGELPSQAMIREALEEVGVFIKPKDLKLVHISFRPKHDETSDRIDFFYRIEHWVGELKNCEPDKCSGIAWFPLLNLPNDLTPHVREAIMGMRRGSFFAELDSNWIKANGMWKL